MSAEQPADDDALEEWLAFSPDEAPRAGRQALGHPLSLLAVVIGLVIGGAMVLLRPTGAAQERAEEALSAIGVPTAFVVAVVSDVSREACFFAPDETCLAVAFRIDQGPDAGRTYEQDFGGGGVTPEFDIGRSVVLSYRAPNGRIEAVEPTGCSFDPQQECSRITVVLTTGADLGSRVTTEVPPGEDDLEIGSDVEVTFDEGGAVLGISGADIASQYQFADFERTNVLLVVTVLFAAAVIALGRWRGVAALAGLGATLVIVLAWLLPAILDGRSAPLVALVGAAAVAYVAIYVSHGFSLMATVALVGTLGALALTTLLSWLTVEAAHFTGFTSEESTLLVLFEGIDLGGLLLAGMVLGAAGALDDVTVTQSSAIWQIRAANPGLSDRELLGRGLRIGQHHIGSTVNTLLLAYLGASLPLAILFVLSRQSLGSIANSEVVAIEVVRTLVGSIGLVAAVPLTTLLAVRTVGGPGRRGRV